MDTAARDTDGRGAARPLFARIFLPFALGYFLSYLYRSVNAVIAPDLVASVGLGAADLGLLTSAYFLTFAAFQLPLGLLLDRFGPRRVEAVLLVVAGAGAFLFSQGESLWALAVGRALVGLGVSACLMAPFKAIVLWFPHTRRALFNGCMMGAGGLGALAATAPVEAALGLTDWRGLFLGLTLATLVVAAAILFVVPRRGEGPRARPEPFPEQLRATLGVFRSPLFLRVAPLTVMVQATLMSVQGLWAGPWLRDVAGLDRVVAANHLLAIAAAMIVGYIGLGALSSLRLPRFGGRPFAVFGAAAVIFMAVQVGILLEWTGLALPLWILFGVFGTCGILTYAALTQAFPVHLSGRVNSAINTLVFTGAFLAQWGMGAVIELWPETVAGGYPGAAYRAAFGTALVLEALAFLWFVLPRRGRAALPGGAGGGE